LRSGGLDPVADASVYGTLQRLFDDGLLESHVVASDNGPARRYYSLTGQGVAALRTGRGSWAAFTEVINRVLGQVGGLDVVHR
jgi:PadR family transcriptional regulator PadR